jgi:hypothetical protein
LADTLAQRRKRATLLASRRVTEHAIFPEDGYVLTPLGGDTQAHIAHAVAVQTSATARRQDRWQDAPLRLHWW